MRRFFSKLLSPWRSRRVPLLPAPSASAAWTEIEALEWNKFLGSPTGRRLIERARALEAHVAVRAVKDSIGTVHSAGVAAGVSEALRWLESLSRVTGDQVTTPDELPPEGETELLERMSP